MPIEYRADRFYQPRGVSNRMAALSWIQRNAIKSGVLYFADDDNTYDIRIFEGVYIDIASGFVLNIILFIISKFIVFTC